MALSYEFFDTHISLNIKKKRKKGKIINCSPLSSLYVLLPRRSFRHDIPSFYKGASSPRSSSGIRLRAFFREVKKKKEVSGVRRILRIYIFQCATTNFRVFPVRSYGTEIPSEVQKGTRRARSFCTLEGVNIKGAFVCVAFSAPASLRYPPGLPVTRFSSITTPYRGVCIIQSHVKRPFRLIQAAITALPF